VELYAQHHHDADEMPLESEFRSCERSDSAVSSTDLACSSSTYDISISESNDQPYDCAFSNDYRPAQSLNSDAIEAEGEQTGAENMANHSLDIFARSDSNVTLNSAGGASGVDFITPTQLLLNPGITAADGAHTRQASNVQTGQPCVTYRKQLPHPAIASHHPQTAM
jgi:hypothetical protein